MIYTYSRTFSPYHCNYVVAYVPISMYVFPIPKTITIGKIRNTFENVSLYIPNKAYEAMTYRYELIEIVSNKGLLKPETELCRLWRMGWSAKFDNYFIYRCSYAANTFDNLFKEGT